MSGECIVCGLKLTDDFIYMLVSGMLASNEAGIHTPAPTFVHRKCGRIAAIFCPHLKRQEHPAVTQDGQMLTHAQLAELAKESG